MLGELFRKSKKKKESPFEITNNMLYRYHSFLNDDTEIAVPETVREIAPFAFENCSRLEKIWLPNGLKTIGEGAFASCRALREIHLPPSLISISKNAFSNCESLREVIMPPDIVQLGEGVFRECRALLHIALPRELTQIPPLAFTGCRKLTEVDFPRRLLGIQKQAFENCRALKEVILPASARYLYPQAFSNCTELCCVTLPERIETIDGGTFSGCTKLSEIRFLHRQGVLTLHNPHMRRQAGMIAEFLRRPSTSQLNWMHAHCAVELMMEFVGGLFMQYPEFAEYLHEHGDVFGQYLVMHEQTETLLELLETGFLSADGLRSCLDTAIAHTQEGGSAEPQMLLMRYVQPDEPATARFRL